MYTRSPTYIHDEFACSPQRKSSGKFNTDETSLMTRIQLSSATALQPNILSVLIAQQMRGGLSETKRVPCRYNITRFYLYVTRRTLGVEVLKLPCGNALTFINTIFFCFYQIYFLIRQRIRGRLSLLYVTYIQVLFKTVTVKPYKYVCYYFITITILLKVYAAILTLFEFRNQVKIVTCQFC